MPDFPSQTFFHAVSSPIPVGITNPIPVTTTLLPKTSTSLSLDPLLSNMALDIVKRIPDRQDFLCFLIGDFDIVLLLQSHDELH